MKIRILAGFALAVMLAGAQAAVVAQWPFNSPIPDGDNKTGTTAPAFGSGSASLVGSNSSSFITGDTKNDPAGSTDNSGWSTSRYPAVTAANKTTGVRFDVSTEGYEQIWVSWFQRHSSTASRYTRVQYTLDGYTFTDADVIAVYADSVYTNKVVSFSAIPGAANNPWFGFQIVTEFESTATGSGTNAYVATKSGSAYSTSGTLAFDMVTVSGTLLPGANTPPGLSALSNQTLRVNQTLGPLSFLVWDQQDPAGALVLSTASSNPAVVAEGDIVFGGNGQNRTLTLTAGPQPGTAVITVSVTDSGGKAAHSSFSVTVLPANTAPVITSPLTRTNTVAGSPVVFPFTVGDLESPAATLTVSGQSANPLLVPTDAAHLTFGGSGSNRTVTITPVPGQTGVAPITLSVSDGVNTTSSIFPLLVTPSAAMLLYDRFDYADGSVLTNSGFLWGNRSGTDGQCQVTNGQLQISSALTEDVVAALIGSPYSKSNGTVLYASFQFNCLGLPRSSPEYFAHFVSGSSLRGRIFVGTTNAGPGCFRLFVANGSETNTMLGMDLHTNTSYLVVSRYAIDNASTTLWLNPVSEADPGVTATDSQSITPISSYAFRQDSGLGTTLLVDELKVGLSFEAVVSGVVSRPILAIERSAAQVVLRWTNPAWVLQSGPTASGPFTNHLGASSPCKLPMADVARFFRLKGL